MLEFCGAGCGYVMLVHSLGLLMFFCGVDMTLLLPCCLPITSSSIISIDHILVAIPFLLKLHIFQPIKRPSNLR